jgi:DNA-binding response OmpR family regulator
MKRKTNILLVEDDKNLGFVTKDFLTMSGYQVNLQEDGAKGLEAFQKYSFNLCLLDVMLPIKDGFELAQEIRKSDENVPIIFLTAKSLKEDTIKGLKIGADDYITKPFSTEELLLRIQAVLKRTLKPSFFDTEQIVFKIGQFTFNYSNMLLKSDRNEQKLTKTEAAVLKLLCQNKNKVLRREDALTTIWGENDYFMGRSMDVYITKLRKFLRQDGSLSIVNIHNIGFKLEEKS